jgi:thioredoxin 1
VARAFAAARNEIIDAAPDRAGGHRSSRRRSTMSELVVAATDANFQSEVVDSKVPTLVDFWAPWCGPCKALTPVLEEIAGEFKGKLKVVKVNTDENPDVAMKHNIRSIPTVLLYKNGQVKETIVGALPKRHFVDMVQKHL